MDACKYLLDNDLLGTERVAIVKDYFDQHQQRMHLDTVFNVIAPKVCLMLKDIQGATSPKRRLVDEYKKNSLGEYEISRHDVEFLQYIEEQGYTVITLTNDMQIAYGCNGLNLGNNTLITVDRTTAKFIARSHKFQGKIIVVDFTNNTNMFGSVHCCSQVISRRPSMPNSGRRTSRHSLDLPSTANTPSHIHMPLPSEANGVSAKSLARPANMARKYVMIAPNNFDVNQATAQDNILMATSHQRFLQKIQQKGQGRRDVHAILLNEFAELHRVLTVKYGIEIHLFTHEIFHRSPDALFVADWFATHAAGDVDDEASLVLFSMKAETRRNERRIDIVQFLSKDYPHVVNLAPCEQGKLEALDTTVVLPSTAPEPSRPLEGSAFVTDRETKMAFAARTCTRLDIQAFELWAKKCRYTPVLFDLNVASTSPHVNLLKSAHHTRVFLAIFSTFAFICSEAIAPSDLQRVMTALSSSKSPRTIIDFTLAQCQSLAITGAFEVFSNAGAEPKSVLIVSATAFSSYTQPQKVMLSSLGVSIEVVSLSEIEQLGGGSVSGVFGSLY